MYKKIVFITFFVLIFGCSKNSDYKFTGSDMSKYNLVSSFELMSHNGEITTTDEFKGSVVALFFGFTHCPDICPTSMQELKLIKKNLGPLAENFQVLFITLDPERDNQNLLKQYVPSFDESFIGLTGTEDQITKIASQYKIFHKKVGEGQAYTIDHSSAIYVLDKNGLIKVRYPYGSDVKGMTKDIKYLISV
jgi:protein SCO1/2